MSIFDNQVRIEVTITLPWAKEEILTYGYAIDHRQAREGLIPLSKDREIDPWSAYEAVRQRERRHDLIELVARLIAGALINACESQDTDHGYETGT